MKSPPQLLFHSLEALAAPETMQPCAVRAELYTHGWEVWEGSAGISEEGPVMPLIPSFCEGAPTASQLILRGSCKLSVAAVPMKTTSVKLRG